MSKNRLKNNYLFTLNISSIHISMVDLANGGWPSPNVRTMQPCFKDWQKESVLAKTKETPIWRQLIGWGPVPDALTCMFPGSEGQSSCGDVGLSQVTQVTQQGISCPSRQFLSAVLVCTQAESHYLLSAGNRYILRDTWYAGIFCFVF